MVATAVGVALFVPACGGSGKTPTSESSTFATSTPTAPRTTVTDLDRNVTHTGWGDGGTGVATAPVTNISRSVADVRVFRRIRIDATGSVRVVSTQDAFVTVLTQRYDVGRTTARLTVHGFVTRDGGVNDYVMQGFGTKGVATIDLPARDDGWAVAPTSWTVVSRDTVAMLFNNTDESAEKVAVIEFWKMSNGEIDTRFGNAGKIDIMRATFGVNAVYDIALRQVEDNGAPHLELLGADNLADGYTSDLFVVGLNPDGSRDSSIGSNGVVSVKSVLGDNTFALRYSPRLADPGIDNSGDSLALVVATSFMDFDPDDGVAPTSQTGYVLADLPVDDPKKIAVSVGASPVEFPMILGAVLDQSGKGFSVLTVGPDGALLRTTVARSRAELSASTSPQTNNMKGFPVGPFSVSMSLNSGTWLGAQVTPHGGDPASQSVNVVVCFDERHCAEGDTAVTRPAMDRPADEFVPFTASSIVAGADGVSVGFQRLSVRGGAGVVKFTNDGAPAFVTMPALISEFLPPDFTTSGKIIGAPAVVQGATLVAGQAPNVSSGLGSLLISRAGEQPHEIKVSAALGVTAYEWNADPLAVLDESSLVLSSLYNTTEDRLARRLHKVSLVNGSTVVPFGPGDAVDVPSLSTSSASQCGDRVRLVSSPGVAALVQYASVFVANADGFGPQCSMRPSVLAWTAVTALDRVFNVQVETPNFDANERIVTFVPDSSGSLYVVSMVDTVIANTPVMNVKLRVRKYTATGAVDATFGDVGIATFDEKTDDVFTGFVLPAATVDSAGRLYLATVRPQGGSQVAAVVRLTATGAVDRAAGVSAHPSTDVAPVRTREEILHRRAELLGQARAVETQRAASETVVIPSVITISGNAPVLLGVQALDDRALTVKWAQSVAAGDTWVTATALPGNRSCTTREKSCVIRGLDAAETYRIVLSTKGEPVPAAETSTQPSINPVRVLRPGQIAAPTSIVRPESRGKATWRVSGKCVLNDNITKLTMPKSPGRCRLAVTTAKDGTTPKTTRSVTIVVRK